jgi:hypothetical protein
LLSEDLPNYFNRRVVREADGLPADALSKALREVMTPDYLRAQALNIVNDVFDFVEGRDFTLDLYLDTRPLKDALRGDGGKRFAHTLAANLPTCAADQKPLASGGTVIRCLPSNVAVDEAAVLITAALPSFLDKFPDQLQLNRQPINMRVELRGAEFWTGLVGSNGLGAAIAFMVFITASFWYVAALIGGVDRRERLLWLGWSLIVPGVLVFMIGLAVNADFTAGWVRFGLNEARFDGFEYSLAFRQALLDVARNALNTVANGFLMAGGVSGAIALALIMWGVGTRPEPRMAPAMATPMAAAIQPAAPSEPPAGTSA